MPTRGDDVDLELEGRLEQPGSLGLLERVAFTLGSTLDLKEVLRRLAEIVHVAAGAQRCSIVLIEGERLRPAVAIGGHPDDDLWTAFRSMPPIELGADEWLLLRRGRALAFEDARTSSYIPRSWIEQFSLRAVALVPLVAHGEPCGVMAVDWPDVRRIRDDELRQLEAIGTYAGIAVHNARLHQRVACKSRTLEHLVDVAASLNSSRSLSSVLDRICDGFQQLLGAAHVSVNLTDPAQPLRVRTLATRGEPWFSANGEGHPAPSPEELLSNSEAWRDDAGPVVYPRITQFAEPGRGRPPTLESAALFPLFGPDGMIGSVVAGFSQAGGPDSDDLDTGQTLAELAAAAIGRADVDEQLRRRLRQLEILAGLSEVVAGTAHLDDALKSVNKALGTDLGIELRWMAVPHRSLRRLLGGRVPDGDEMKVIRSWRSLLAEGGRRLGLRTAGDDLLVPVVHRNQVQGALRVRQTGELVLIPDEEFLMAIGAACAEVVHRAGLSQALRHSEQRLVIAAERDRIAQDLHDSAGQILVALGLDLAEQARRAPDEHGRQRLQRLHHLACRAEQELRDAIYALLFMQVRERGLIESIEELVDRFEATTGISVEVLAEGESSLSIEGEEALFRVACEALANVERHSVASHVEVRVALDDDLGLLEVRDDGVGFHAGDHEGPNHYGFEALARRLSAVGGALRTGNGAGGGAVVTASVPGEGPER